MDMETRRQMTDRKLAESTADSAHSKKRLSKRAKKKLDKQLADKNISDIEKKII